MGSIDAPRHELWRAAIASALGPLSAYLTPRNYGISVFGLSAGENEDDEFRFEIQKRIDLGRASAVADAVDAIGPELPHSYRHFVQYSEDQIDGVLIVPRLVRERAAGRPGRIPVLRAARFVETPEALLTSELLRVSSQIARAWSATRGAEGLYAQQLATRLSIFEAQQPWAALRARPRSSLRSLASSVKNRAVAGRTARGGTFDQLADLVLRTPGSVTVDAGPIAFLLSDDERYADRVFELVCIGWLLSGLKRMDPAGSVNPEALRSSGEAIFSGTCEDVRVDLHYQAGYLSKNARYTWRNSGNPLRAIPDYSIELKGPGWSRCILLDAKNRVYSSHSEIIYKMLGYRENLAISPYLAIGLAPNYGARAGISAVDYDKRTAMVARIPLCGGKRLFQKLLPNIISRLSSQL